MAFKKGEIYWINLGDLPSEPYSPDDLADPPEIVGHEQAMLRPCIILSDANTLKVAQIVPMTSSKSLKSQPTVILIPAGTGGLKRDGYVLVHQIRTISHNRIVGAKIGDMPQNFMDDIDVILADMFGL